MIGSVVGMYICNYVDRKKNLNSTFAANLHCKSLTDDLSYSLNVTRLVVQLRGSSYMW